MNNPPTAVSGLLLLFMVIGVSIVGLAILLALHIGKQSSMATIAVTVGIFVLFAMAMIGTGIYIIRWLYFISALRVRSEQALFRELHEEVYQSARGRNVA